MIAITPANCMPVEMISLNLDPQRKDYNSIVAGNVFNEATNIVFYKCSKHIRAELAIKVHVYHLKTQGKLGIHC